MVNEAAVQCAFCRGRGVDPFGIMSHLSSCCVCGGGGKVSIKRPHARCAFCRCTGVYPLSRLTCTACGGSGVSHVLGPNMTCAHCLGTGVDPRSKAGFYCLTCHGAGVVTLERGLVGGGGTS